MASLDKIVVITRKTALDELISRFNTRDQARFYIEHMGESFSGYESAHDAYVKAVETLRKAMPRQVRAQWIDRSFLPTFTFGPDDLVVTLGQDGLVVNTAKYLNDQPLLAFNPDPSRIDGILSSFPLETASREIALALERSSDIHQYAMAEAKLNDGRSILAVNDLFIGAKTHVSARYTLRHGNEEETQSSSGIIVSTGAGSTGWYRAIVTGSAEIMSRVLYDGKILQAREMYAFDPRTSLLVFCVREPFASRTSSAYLVHGVIHEDKPLVIRSEMPQNGVIFSDGIEEDFLPVQSGSIATVGIADRKLRLIRSPEQSEPDRRRRRGWTGGNWIPH